MQILPPAPTRAGCSEPCIFAQRDAQSSAAAADADLSYWQLLAAQCGSTEDRRRADGPYGLFLLSAVKAHSLAVHLSQSALVYHSCLATASEPGTPLAVALGSAGVTVADVVRHGMYGITVLDSRQVALVMGLALDCVARRHVPGLGSMTVWHVQACAGPLFVSMAVLQAGPAEAKSQRWCNISTRFAAGLVTD